MQPRPIGALSIFQEIEVVQILLQSAEHCEIELPCDDTLGKLTVRAVGGNCAVDIQASRDGMTWGTPVGSARLHDAQPKTIQFSLPEGTRKIRVLVQNGQGRATNVELEDPSEMGDLPIAAPENESEE